MTRITATLPPELQAELEQTARANERSLAGEVRVALREHLDFDTTTTPAPPPAPLGAVAAQPEEE